MSNPQLPSRMFAVGEEPKGIRVTAYHKSRAIARILKSLDEDEVAFLRTTTFGKFISLAEKPAFSGRFARFIISRQLKVDKPHEIWILFAAKPIRISLREFAIVTGLPCGKFPQKSKKKLKKSISESSNWSKLFGSLKTITVKSVISLLAKKTVTDRDTRIKYACLALLVSVLLTTTHNPKIVPEHAEAIKDLDDFFAFPWGRLAFDLMMSSIKERDEVSLSQKTLAIKGFVHALQLVMVEAVPAITEVVQIDGDSSSDSEEDGEKEMEKNGTSEKVSLSPAHARSVHDAGVAIVDSIIADDGEVELDESDFCWSDDEEDVKVTNMLRLIGEEHPFSNDMFTGGVTKEDVEIMKKEALEKKMVMKGEKAVVGETSNESSFALTDGNVKSISDVVSARVKDHLKSVEDNVRRCITKSDEVKVLVTMLEGKIMESVQGRLTDMQEVIINRVTSHMDQQLKNTGDMTPLVSPRTTQNGVQKPVHSDVASHPRNQNQSYEPNALAADLVISSVVRDLNNGNGTHHNRSNEHVYIFTSRNIRHWLFGHPQSNPHNVYAQVLGGTTTRNKTGDEDNAKASKGAGEQDCNEQPPFVRDHSQCGGLDEQSQANPPHVQEVLDGPTIRNKSGDKDNAKTPKGTCEQDRNENPPFRGDQSHWEGLDEQSQANPCHAQEKKVVCTTPSFSLGLSQAEHDVGQELADMEAEMEDHAPLVENGIGFRKSKRMKTVPASLVGEFHCDKRLLHLALGANSHMLGEDPNVSYGQKFESVLNNLKSESRRLAYKGTVITSEELIDIAARIQYLTPKVMDALMWRNQDLYNKQTSTSVFRRVKFLDTKFLSLLAKNPTKFMRATKKESHKFQKALLGYLIGDPESNFSIDRFYCPFNLDQKHWIGLCIDCATCSIHVLDCFTQFRGEAALKKELLPLASMFPYALKQACPNISFREPKPYLVDRVKGVPQASILADAGVTAVLLMQAHAVAGVDGCKCITSDVIPLEAQKMAVAIYEDVFGLI